MYAYIHTYIHKYRNTHTDVYLYVYGSMCACACACMPYFTTVGDVVSEGYKVRAHPLSTSVGNGHTSSK